MLSTLSFQEMSDVWEILFKFPLRVEGKMIKFKNCMLVDTLEWLIHGEILFLRQQRDDEGKNALFRVMEARQKLIFYLV